MRRLLYFFGVIVLLFIAGSAFAQTTDSSFAQTTDSSISQAYQAGSNMTPPESDYSVAYLNQVFGTVGNVLAGGGSQIVGKMFKVFNEGVLVVAALWLAYTTITLVLNAAIQGSFGGQKNIATILLRIAFGFALIIPSSTTGYSLLQDIFMKIVVQGVGLADKTWDKALDYLQYGGNLYIPPASLNQDTAIITNAMGTVTTADPVNPPPSNSPSAAPVVSGYASQIFVDEVCMLEAAQSNSTTYLAVSPIYSPPPSIATPSTPGSVTFPGTPTGNCGVATPYAMPSSDYITLNAEQTQHFYTDSYAALKQLVLSIMPAAKAYVNAATSTYNAGVDYHNTSVFMTMANLVAPQAGSSEYTCPTTGSSKACNPTSTGKCSSGCDLINRNAKALFTAIVAYGNLITPAQQLLNSVSGIIGTSDNSLSERLSSVRYFASQDKYSFINQAKGKGWIMAGGFYWDVEQTNNNSTALNISALGPTVTAPRYTMVSTLPTNHIIADSANDVVSYTTVIGTLWNQYVGAQQNNISITPNTQSGASGFASSMEGDSLGAFSGFSLSNANAYNPIATLMNEGEKILKAVMAIWIAAIGLSALVAIGAGVCSSTSPGAVIFQAVLTWLKSIMMLITTLLLMPGAILAYYVPLYPFAVFTFAAIGWIIMVVEGMAAAPLVCIGMTHPEGHDFLGKAEQALMLFLGIFVRPALMVIGLVAAMVISFAAFGMLTSGFGTVLNSLMTSTHSALGNAFLKLISICMVLIIFGTMTMELIEQCYKLIYQLPNAILQWIGGPQTGQDFGQMAQGVKGAVSAGASAGKEAMQGIDSANTALVGSLRKAKKLQDAQSGGSGIEGE